MNGVQSSQAKVQSGVFRGSIFGPLLTLIYISDLALACKSCEVFLVADDTNINGLSCRIQEINNDLDKVSQQLKANKLSLSFKTAIQVNKTNKTASSN